MIIMGRRLLFLLAASACLLSATIGVDVTSSSSSSSSKKVDTYSRTGSSSRRSEGSSSSGSGSSSRSSSSRSSSSSRNSSSRSSSSRGSSSSSNYASPSSSSSNSRDSGSSRSSGSSSRSSSSSSSSRSSSSSGSNSNYATPSSSSRSSGSSSSKTSVTTAPVITSSDKPAKKGKNKGDKDDKKRKKDDKPKQKSMEQIMHERLFNSSYFRSYHILMHQNDLQKLDANPIAEVYYPCSVIVDFGQPEFEERFDGAGCRYKGSVGSLRICVDPETNMAKPNDVCRKLSWKIDANKFVPEDGLLYSNEEGRKKGKKRKKGSDKKRTKDQKIWGEKKIIFNGLAVDHSLMSERVAYSLIRDAGMVAPRAVHAKLYVNNVFDGVYSFVEAPDEEFTEDNFREDANKGKGALYKDALVDNERSKRYFARHRESGKDMDEYMAELSEIVSNTKRRNAVEVLETYFDTESIVNVTAFNTVIGMTDDWRKRHNFFWYLREDWPANTTKADRKSGAVKTIKKLVMIPWDYDRINDSMAKSRGVPGAPKHWYDPFDKHHDLCTARDPKPKEYAAQYPREQQVYWREFFSELPPGLSRPINCDHFTRLMASALKERIQDRIEYYAKNIITPEIIEKKLTAYATQIEKKVDKDEDPPMTRGAWKKAIKDLYDYLIESRQQALNDIRGKDIPDQTMLQNLNSFLGNQLLPHQQSSHSHSRHSSSSRLSSNGLGQSNFGSWRD